MLFDIIIANFGFWVNLSIPINQKLNNILNTLENSATGLYLIAKSRS